MKCKKCGATNSNENKFCFQCGTEIKVADDELICPKCGVANNKSSIFCIDCGTELKIKKKINKSTHKRKHAPKKSNKIHSKKRLPLIDLLQENKALAGVALLIIAFVIFQMLPGNKSLRIPKYYNQNNNANFAGFVGNKTLDIASKFICSCGTCDNLSLETCACSTAKEEKAFIKSQIDAQKSDLEIIKAVNTKYGWIKSQFKDLLTAKGKDVRSKTKTNKTLNNSI